MDSLHTRILQDIEAYMTEDNAENDGWIRLELLSRSNKLSCYNYDRLLQALCSKRSNIIELSSFEPRCIRCRYPSISKDSIQDNRTVTVTGLPHDIKCEDLIQFFNCFYPIEEIKMFSSKRFNGKIHVIFNRSQDALAFVRQSKQRPMIYTNDDIQRSCNGYTLICTLLHRDLPKPNDQHDFIKGKSFSTRLGKYPSHPASNPDISMATDTSVGPKFCLKSDTSPTEQILFCQNVTNNKPKTIDNTKQKLVYNKFSYDFYLPNHLLSQTYKCIVISVLNPHCFTVQLTQHALEFDKFQREMNAFYNTNNDRQYYLTPEQIRINLCVMCADSKASDENKIWNRSQIVDFDSTDNTVNLFYVDLGTWEEYVPIHRLRHITDRFHQYQVFSLTCRLAHIVPFNNDHDNLTWTDEATNQFIAVLDQVIPEIEFLSLSSNGCLQTNVFVINSDQHVCVNDYMIHIRQAKAVLNFEIDNGQNSIQAEKDDINGNGPPYHPVVALYHRLGEVLQRSVIESRTASTSSSSIPSPSTSSQLSVKLIHVDIGIDNSHREEYHNTQRTIPIIFVRHRKTILVPDFNICTLLELINPSVNIHTIENYATAIRYKGVHITLESNFDIFTQLSSLNEAQHFTSITLYTLDFVVYILEHNNFRISNVLIALEDAKYAQFYESDLHLWFSTDNEFAHVSNDSTKNNQFNDQLVRIPSTVQQPPIPIRLPFSNRLINPM